MKRGFWWRKQGPSPLFPRQTRVRIRGAAMGGIILFGNAPRYPLPLLLPHGGSRLGFDGEKADGGLKARAAGTACLQTRAVARRRFQPSGRRHRNRSGGFCCFSPPKSRENEKEFLSCTFEAKSTKSLRTSFSAGGCEARRSPHPLSPRQTRVRIRGAAVGGIFSIWQCTPAFFLPARRSPTWFRWRKSGRRAESDSGGDGLLANPRIVARRRFQTFGRRHRNRSGGFCCFSTPKSREKRKSFPQEDRKSQKVFERTFAAAFRHRKAEEKKKDCSCTFEAKSTKSLRTSFSAGVREPRRCTGRARSSLCATPWRTRRCPHPLFPRQTRVRIRGAATGGKGY